ncbi:MAG TPA: hypothetical protein PK156_20865 [Polyangium sp.]|nr:hypothetical protein [Polyangium sp.]
MAQVRYDHASVHSDDLPEHVEPLGFDLNKALEVATKTTKENPHAALAAATALGFVLGGGMTPKLVGAIALFISRRYFQATVEASLQSLQSFTGQTQPKL